MTLFAKFVRYQDFVQRQLVEHEIDESCAATELDRARAKYLDQSWSGASSERVTIAKSKATLDPKVQERDDEYQMIRARRKLYGVLLDTLQRDAALLSRELSRRGNREPYERRVDRWQP